MSIPQDAEMEGRALVCCARTHMRLQQSTSAVRELHLALKIGKDVGSPALVEEVYTYIRTYIHTYMHTYR